MIYSLVLFFLFCFAIEETLQIQFSSNFKMQQQYLHPMIITQKSFSFIAYFSLVIFITLLSALRGRLGTDWFVYKQLFEAILYNPKLVDDIYSGIEKGYLFVNKLFTYFTNNYFIFQFCISVFTCFVIFKNFWKNSFSPFLILFIYYTNNYLGVNFEFLRQGLAIVILIMGLKFIKEKKIIIWTLIVLLAMQFHISAITAFPLYFTTYKKTSKKMAILLLFTALIITFCGNVIIRNSLLFLGKIPFLPHRIESLIKIYLSSANMHGRRVEFNSGYGFIVNYSVYIFILFLCFKDNNKSKDFFLLNFLLYIVIMAIGRNVSIFNRCAVYYFVCGNGIFAYGIISERNRTFYKRLDFVRVCLVFLFLLFFSLNFYRGLQLMRPSGKTNAEYYIPYKTFLQDE